MNEIFLTGDGSHSVNSEKFGTAYHSIFGALSESLHVFIGAGLDQFTKDKVSILEIGFGTGLNAFLTAIESKRRAQTIYYETFEAYPLRDSEIDNLNYGSIVEQGKFNSLFLDIHQSKWEENVAISPTFQLCKKNDRFENIQSLDTFNLIFFDAFAPSTQPELWDESMMQKMYDALKKGGILVTYCAKGSVKRALKAAGFKIEGIPGPPRKREMTRAWKD